MARVSTLTTSTLTLDGKREIRDSVGVGDSVCSERFRELRNDCDRSIVGWNTGDGESWNAMGGA